MREKGSSRVCNQAVELGRRGVAEALEDARQVALIAEAAGSGDFGNVAIRL